jgi:hypothetical protein
MKGRMTTQMSLGIRHSDLEPETYSTMSSIAKNVRALSRSVVFELRVLF